MSGSHDEARKTVQHLAKDHRVDEDTLRELEWEDLCLDVKLDAHAGVNKMLAAIKTGQSHFHFAYALDTIQWSLASGDLDLIHAAPKVKNLYRRFAIDTDRYRVEYTAVKSLSDLYVDGPSLRQSLEALAALMGMSSQFISLEREMLLLRSARMWLTRNKMRRLADHCELRYRSFSYGLSGGVSEDVLFELVP
jgi:hypothetical protein